MREPSPALLRALCKRLGFDPKDVSTILVEPREVTVFTYQRDDQGRVIRVGVGDDRQPAESMTVLPVVG